jgi:hypothetical protein
VLADERRADRLLALTGLTPDELRGSLMEAPTHAAVLDFLLGNEADLVAAAEELDVPPQAFAQARESIPA